MAFTDKPQVFGASIKELTIGAEGREVVLGGGNVNPLYTFDAALPNAPKVGVLISDKGFDQTIPGLAAFYEGCATVPEMAKKACGIPGCAFIVLTMDSADPNGDNASVEDEAELAKAVYEAIDKPLAIGGCKNMEKDTALFSRIGEVLQGKNVMFLSAKEEDYKTIGASAVMAYGQTIGAESAVDINLAKQLNVLLSQMGVPTNKVVMCLGTAAAGYGFEYLASTIERVKGAALGQNDNMLQSPVVINVGDDAWNVKEALLEEADMPEWGTREERGIQMEIVTASATLASGADAVLLRHPESVKTISGMIADLM